MCCCLKLVGLLFFCAHSEGSKMQSDQTLKEFVKQHSQFTVAAMMGVTQGAVSQMTRSERDIRVTPDKDSPNGYRFYEIRPLGKTSEAA